MLNVLIDNIFVIIIITACTMISLTALNTWLTCTKHNFIKIIDDIIDIYQIFVGGTGQMTVDLWNKTLRERKR
jgi:hypothetical protein